MRAHGAVAAIRRIAERHGLPDARPRRFSQGTHLVYAVGREHVPDPERLLAWALMHRFARLCPMTRRLPEVRPGDFQRGLFG